MPRPNQAKCKAPPHFPTTGSSNETGVVNLLKDASFSSAREILNQTDSVGFTNSITYILLVVGKMLIQILKIKIEMKSR